MEKEYIAPDGDENSYWNIFYKYGTPTELGIGWAQPPEKGI
jgi:hypothetical protein